MGFENLSEPYDDHPGTLNGHIQLLLLNCCLDPASFMDSRVLILVVLSVTLARQIFPVTVTAGCLGTTLRSQCMELLQETSLCTSSSVGTTTSETSLLRCTITTPATCVLRASGWECANHIASALAQQALDAASTVTRLLRWRAKTLKIVGRSAQPSAASGILLA